MDEPSNSPLPSAVFPAGRVKLPGKALKAISVDEDSFSRQSDFDAANAVIMMVDDELLNIEMTQAFLEDAGYKRFAATHESELAIEYMRLRPPHVLLLDLSMPKVSGMEILEQMRNDEKLRHIPVIVLTSSADAPTKLRALGLGAMDFLAKPVDPSELALRLRNTLAATAYRDYLANHDPLTGLRNRLSYVLEVEAAVQTASDRGHGCALLHMGVDRLSQVNDAMGRAAGDVLLQRMAKRLRQCVESAQGGELGPFETQYPHLYRFDGDEFAILVPFLDEIESAAGFITSLLDAAAASFRVGDKEVFVTASLGVAVFPMDGRTPDELISNAGLAMKHAKQAGRNTYEFFSPELNERAVSALRIGGDIRRALTRDELSMLYQPKINVRTGKLMGAETVLRWTQPDGKVVEGNQVIQLAGTAEMGMVLAEWMFEQVGKQTRIWQEAGLVVVPLGINLSLRQFPLPLLLEIVSVALKSGAQPAFLCLELSGLSGLDDPQEAANATGKFREWGLRVALDHFGTADATLSHLNGLSVDEIKVDPSFMVNIEENKLNATIMRAMIGLAGSLGITLVATGIQTPQQLAFLKDNKAEQCQGRLFNNPMPAEEFAAKWLETSRKWRLTPN